MGKSILMTGMTGFFGFPFLNFFFTTKIISDFAPIYILSRDKSVVINRLRLVDDLDLVSY